MNNFGVALLSQGKLKEVRGCTHFRTYHVCDANFTPLLPSIIGSVCLWFGFHRERFHLTVVWDVETLISCSALT